MVIRGRHLLSLMLLPFEGATDLFHGMQCRAMGSEPLNRAFLTVTANRYTRTMVCSEASAAMGVSDQYRPLHSYDGMQ